MAQSTTTATPSVKKYVDYANQQVDEQAILDKYNAATLAQFNIQREQNRQAENAFYNQMYNTQRTAMDTIRKSNAAAVSTGASRGVQAANELSALLGLQQESVQSATEIAQTSRQTAQEETAAVLENVLNAYQQASQERSQLVSQGIEAASVDAQEAANEVAAMEAQTNRMAYEQTQRDARQSAAETGFTNYMAEITGQGLNYSGEYSAEGLTSLDLATNSLTAKGEGQPNDGVYFTANDFATGWDREIMGRESELAQTKVKTLQTDITRLCSTYGLNIDDYKTYFDDLNALTKDNYDIRGETADKNNLDINSGFFGYSKADLASAAQAQYTALITKIRADYIKKGTTKKE
jgi:hypothetical protein